MDHRAPPGRREEIVKRLLALVVLWPLIGTVNGAEPLGRLFYTPAQRAQLDGVRARKHVAPSAAEPEQPAPVPEVLRYDGIVRSSDGRTTLWINNRAITGGKPTGELPVPGRARPDHRISLTLPQAGRDVELSVGQSVDVVSGSVHEVYARPGGADAEPATRSASGKSAERAERAVRTAPDEEDGERARR